VAKFLWIYFVVVIAWVCLGFQTISFWVSWLGSLSFLVYTLFFLSGQENYGSWQQQPLRPLYLPHFVFATYMSLTSVFFFWDTQGYYFFDLISGPKPEYLQNLIVKAQFFYLLGHAGLLHGILLNFRYDKVPAFQFKTPLSSSLALKFSLYGSIILLALALFPALSQLTVRLDGLLLTITAFSLASAISEKKFVNSLISSVLFALSMRTAILSGMKEAIVMPLLLLVSFLLPIYKTRILIFVMPAFAILLLLLPIYSNVFRTVSWEQGLDSKTASEIAIKESQNFGNQKNKNIQWEFLTTRLSEIKMFTQYISNVPDKRPFYDWQIIDQGIKGLLPRVIFPSKANLEELVMVRVRENKIIEDYSTFVSAKPMIVVDGYLSFGALGVWLFCFLTGFFSAFYSRVAENYFGSYLIGSGIFFNGLFSIFWRGNCFEFFVNNVFWSAILMFFIFFLFRTIGLIRKTKDLV